MNRLRVPDKIDRRHDIFLIEHDVHLIIDVAHFSGLVITHFLIQMQVSLFLQDRIQAPMIRTIQPLCLPDCGLRQPSASACRHDPQGGDALAAAILPVHDADHAGLHAIFHNEIVHGACLFKPVPDPVDSFPLEPDFENSCDSSACRYHYYYKKRLNDPFLQTQNPSINWGKQSVRACGRVTSKKETAKIRIPVLVIQAGNDTVVKNASQDLFASRVKGCELYRVPDMKHELYMTDSDVLIPYWEKIFAFLG